MLRFVCCGLGSVLVALSLASSPVAQAQDSVFIGSISGRLIDSRTGQPLGPLASVALTRCDDTTCDGPIFGHTIPDDQGRFRIERDGIRRIVAGRLQVIASAPDHALRRLRVSVGSDENLDVGDLVLEPAPIVIRDIQPCDPADAQRGMCTYSARIENNTDQVLTGVAFSPVTGIVGLTPSTEFEASTGEGLGVLRAELGVPPRSSQAVGFRFSVPAFLTNGASICAELSVGTGNVPLLDVKVNRTVFCLDRGEDDFRLRPLAASAALMERVNAAAAARALGDER